MKLKTLSATSADTFAACPARWKAVYEDQADEEASSAAALGTALHLALEWFVAGGHHLGGDPAKQLDTLTSELWPLAFRQTPGTQGKDFDAGVEMLTNWLTRQDWENRTVLSTEQKSHFVLPTSEGDIPFNYIWDRCDRLSDGSIEVVDYKSWVRNANIEDVRNSTQPRCYALAAQLQFPDADEVWVTLDQLRYSEVSVRFTKEQNRETWRWLRQLAEDIIASDGSQEQINSNCRWCIRRHACDALRKHLKVGGPLSITDPDEAALKRRELENVKGAIDSMMRDLDAVILGHAEEVELTEWATDDGVNVRLSAGTKRSVDAERVARLLGEQTARFITDYGGLTVAALERAIKDDHTWLTQQQRDELANMIRVNYGEIRVLTR